MSIDYLVCKKCGDGFPDVCDYISCDWDCGNTWCCDECAKEDGYIEEYPEGITEIDEPEKSCKYCRLEDFTDTQILEFVLEHIVEFEMTRDDVVKHMRGG